MFVGGKEGGTFEGLGRAGVADGMMGPRANTCTDAVQGVPNPVPRSALAPTLAISTPRCVMCLAKGWHDSNSHWSQLVIDHVYHLPPQTETLTSRIISTCSDSRCSARHKVQ